MGPYAACPSAVLSSESKLFPRLTPHQGLNLSNPNAESRIQSRRPLRIVREPRHRSNWWGRRYQHPTIITGWLTRRVCGGMENEGEAVLVGSMGIWAQPSYVVTKTFCSFLEANLLSYCLLSSSMRVRYAPPLLRPHPPRGPRQSCRQSSSPSVVYLSASQ